MWESQIPRRPDHIRQQLPEDVVFILFGAVPVVLAVLVAYVPLWTDRGAAIAARVQSSSPTAAHPQASFRAPRV